MFGNGQKYSLILGFIIISSVIKIVYAQYAEFNLEIDTEEEQQILEGKKDEKDTQNDDENVGFLLAHQYGPEENSNQEDKENLVPADEAKEKLNEKTIAEHSLDKTQEIITGNKQIKSEPFKFKELTEKEEEPGFDLTSDDMKKFKIWKDGVIPYYIDVVSFSDGTLRDRIRNILHMINSATSVNFVEIEQPPTDDKERWVFFINRRGLLGCADHTVNNFTNHGVQQVVLGYDCMATKGELGKAVMSIVGVPAQHNAPDRDKYIKVNTENIMPDKTHLFQKLNDNDWLFHDLQYDFKSITHYDMYEYSANGRATIEIKEQSDDLSPSRLFSETDLLKIKMLYNYITRNKQLQTPMCKKLFEPGNKSMQPNSSKKNIKPRKKPRKYLGIADDNKDESLERGNTNEKVSGDEEPEEDNNTPEEKQRPDEDHGIENKDEIESNMDRHDESYTEMPQLKSQHLKGSKGKIVDPLALLSDYDSKERVRMKLKLPPQIDLLAYLSDYQTGDERDRKRRIQQIRKKTINYSNKKHAYGARA